MDISGSRRTGGSIRATIALRLGRPAPWREVWHRLKTVASDDEAIEAIGDLRELLEEEDLLLPDGGT